MQFDEITPNNVSLFNAQFGFVVEQNFWCLDEIQSVIKPLVILYLTISIFCHLLQFFERKVITTWLIIISKHMQIMKTIAKPQQLFQVTAIIT